MILKSVQIKAGSIWRKNGQDIKATLSGRLPRFLQVTDSSAVGSEIPVFVYHSVEPVLFEAQLRYLVENGYETIAAGPLLEMMSNENPRHPKIVALTFDDATGSFWAVAFPLLKKYGCQAILFAIPGLVPEDKESLPDLEDVWAGRASIEDVVTREKILPLCTWAELQTMHQSGLVDIQGHTLTHHLINISPKIVDFIHPGFDTYFFENVNIPISRNESIERPLRKMRLGQPIYQSASRMSGKARLFEDTRISENLSRYVERAGSQGFFARAGWRGELQREYRRLLDTLEVKNEFESSAETEAAIRFELGKSKEILEAKLPGKKIAHLCYPWFQGSALSDRIAGELGYETVFYGLETASRADNALGLPRQIKRISEEYIFCLPGQGRKSIFSVWKGKVSNFAKG